MGQALVALCLLVAASTAQLDADFDVSTTSGTNPATIEFTDLTTGGPPHAWFWDFGDGATSNQQHPTHTYTTPGTYSVSLSVYLGLQIASVEKVDLIVVEPAVFAPDFSATPTTGLAPLTVAFAGTSDGAQPDWWNWDFGGSPGFGVGDTTEHTFLQPGTYTVTLTAGFGGQTATVSKTAFITVGDLPTSVAKGKWLASDGSAHEWFGWSVALDDGVAVIGAPGGAFGHGKGAAELIDAATGARLAVLETPNPVADDQFGISVDIDGDLVAVGALSTREVHLFDRQGTHLATIGEPADLFGMSVALDGERLVVGARNDHEVGLLAGSAFLYDVSDPTDPVRIQKLLPSAGGSYFGGDVAIAGNRVLVGAIGKNPGDLEAAYLFEIPASGPVVLAHTLQQPEDEAGGNFGQSVALAGGLALVGAPNGPGLHGQGLVAVFDVATGEQLALVASPGIPGSADFGTSLAFDGTTALVGATGGNPDQVLRYGFSDPTAPELIARLLPLGGNTSDEFGWSVAFDGDHAVVGSYEDDDLAAQAGAAHVFAFGLGSWTDVGQGLAGAHGTPVLTGTGPLTGASSLNLLLTGAVGNAPTFLVVGFTGLSAPLLGGVLVPSPDVIVPTTTDSSGDRLISAVLPAGLPGGASFLLQHWIVDATGPSGFAASNGLQATTP